MSDIFISYKREEQPIARKLADALELEGWSVWWDPKLRAGEHFDDVIEAALKESKCVIVLWSSGSLQSRYVRDEATYALEHNKLVPVAIENVELPLRFRGVHTLTLSNWGRSADSLEYGKLVEDISGRLDNPQNRIAREQSAPEGKQRSIEDRYREERKTQGPRIPGLKPLVKIGLAVGAAVLLIVGLVIWLSVRAKQEPAGTVFLDRLKLGGEGPTMIVVPAGTFQMGDIQGGGDQDEKPVHIVRIRRPFAIGRYEVTFDDYDRFANVTGRKAPDDIGWGRGRRPVVNISWQDAKKYSDWLSEQTGKRYRLPTEAEWEYAARAGTEMAYWWGKELISGMANCYGCGSQWDKMKTAPVGSFKANAFGLHDTAGNVWEWVEDCWHNNYYGAPADGSAWLEPGGKDCGQRVMRGGSYFSGPAHLRTSYRRPDLVTHRFQLIGFRLARDLE
jgi:formylglycine-generating enzyme required for sulfatase activity